MIRLLAIELENFCNIEFGRVDFCQLKDINPDDLRASITGLYGQNGSGKTSVIEALGILKDLMMGQPLDAHVADRIMAGKERFKIKIEYCICSVEDGDDFTWFREEGAKARAKAIYEVEVSKDAGSPRVVFEKISYKPLSGAKSAKTLFQYSSKGGSVSTDAIGPTTYWRSLTSKFNDVDGVFKAAPVLAYSEGTSLFFSDYFLEITKKLSDIGASDSSKTKAFLRAYAEVLVPAFFVQTQSFIFAVNDLSVITTAHHVGVSLNLVNMVSPEGKRYTQAGRTLLLDVSSPQSIGLDAYEALTHTVQASNQALSSLIPELYLKIKELGDVVLDDGRAGKSIEVMAVRGDNEFPFRCESEGVRKIVAILVALINAYSNPRACVAIDEIDSGVFEFLLGEILEVIEGNGCGQLIFTAHNLRPLETLSPASLYFTTTNPARRYIPFRGHQKTNNMRDQYLRAVNLGGQAEEVYEPTSKYEIDSAFYDAGRNLQALRKDF